MFHGNQSLNSASPAASEFYEPVHVRIDVYIPHRKYQVKPHSSPWFSSACAAVIVHRNHFFRLHEKNKSSESKVKFDRLVIVAKGFLLKHMLKQKSPSLPRNLAWDFWQITNSVPKKGKSAIAPLFSSLEGLTSASDKAKLFAEFFSKNSNLDDSGVSLPVFPLNLDLLKACGVDCIPDVVLITYILSERVLFSRLLEGFISGPCI